jgi:hypothetical protein
LTDFNPDDVISFEAYAPPAATFLRFFQDGARVTLDVPASELEHVKRLIDWMGDNRLMVSIARIEDA